MLTIDTGTFSLSSMVVQRPRIFSTWQFAIVAMNNIANTKILRIIFIFRHEDMRTRFLFFSLNVNCRKLLVNKYLWIICGD